MALSTVINNDDKNKQRTAVLVVFYTNVKTNEVEDSDF